MREIYTEIDHKTWRTLISKRSKSLPKQACDLYIKSLNQLKLPLSYIPTCEEMNALMAQFTQWKMIPSRALVTAVDYFKMLSNYQFPAITSIRAPHEIKYFKRKEPDVIHEFFGHAPFLINPDFGTFMQKLAKRAARYSPQEQILLARIFWFTIEFGLIETNKGLRAFGAGIIPSEEESQHALENPAVDRREFNLLDILRTTFTSTAKQSIYYVLRSFDALYLILNENLDRYLSRASSLGSFSANTLKIKS